MRNKIVDKEISIEEIKTIAKGTFGDLVKAVVDVKKEIMAIDGELHADEETLLLQSGSRQEYLWGINLYPELPKGEWIEFDSMINLRPSLGNKSRGVDDLPTKRKITAIVNKLVKR